MSTVPPGLERQIRATARQITRQAKVPIPNAPHNDVIYGTVTAVASTFPVTVTLSINGDAVNTLAGVACLNSYKPKVGDIVFCSKYGPDLVVVDKLPQRFTASIVQNSSALTGRRVRRRRTRYLSRRRPSAISSSCSPDAAERRPPRRSRP